MLNLVTWVAVLAMTAACGVTGGTNTAPADNGTELGGKTIAFIGDSICYGTNYHGGYAKIIGEDEGMSVTNAGLGGATIARGVKWTADSDGIRPNIIDMAEGLDGEFDYIITEGGVNDFWNHAPLGELTDGFEGDFDDTTYAGALETIFYDIRALHPESKAGYVIIHDPFTYDAEEGFAPFYEMTKAACDKWGVPYLDLYAVNNQTVGVNVRDAEQKRKYFSASDNPDGDGCHPNEEGYRQIYVGPMTEWLKTL